MPRSVRVLFGALALAGSALMLASCSTSASAKDLASKLAGYIAAQENIPTPTVTCPKSLPAKVGATETCSMTPQNSSAKYDVPVVVSSVSGRTLNITWSLKCVSNCGTTGVSGQGTGTTGAATGSSGNSGAPAGSSGSSGATSSS